MLKLLVMTEKEVRTLDVVGLMAIGGSTSSGVRLDSLKFKDDYAVLSAQGDKLVVHSLKGKKLGVSEVKPLERLALQDLTLIPLDFKPLESPSESTSIEKQAIGELARLFNFMSGQVDLAPTLQQILSSLIELFKMEKGFVVAKGNQEGFEIIANDGVDPSDPWLSETLLEETLKTANPVFVQNVIGSSFENNRSLMATGFLSVFTWPLRLRGEALGALVVGSTKPHSGLSEFEKLAAELYSQVSAFLLQAHLNDLRLREQVEALKQVRVENDGPFLTTDKKTREVSVLAAKVAPTELSILIQGETGVGKEVLARWMHSHSECARGPFVALNCGAIPENLLESTLFGHKKGSFTGAHADQIGKFQQAHTGTLFLDEIADLPAALQVKLLRVLQERVVEPIGANRATPVSVRVLSASHKNLFDLVRTGRFREDLYFRLAEVTLEIPPLRERPDDIGLLATEFLRHGSSQKRLSSEAWSWIRQQNWPGNVRELLSSLKRAVILSSTDEVGVDSFLMGLPAQSQKLDSNWLGGADLDEAMRGFLLGKVQRALELSSGNRKQAAELLGVTPRTLFRYLEDFRGEMTDLSV